MDDAFSVPGNRGANGGFDAIKKALGGDDYKPPDAIQR